MKNLKLVIVLLFSLSFASCSSKAPETTIENKTKESELSSAEIATEDKSTKKDDSPIAVDESRNSPIETNVENVKDQIIEEHTISDSPPDVGEPATTPLELQGNWNGEFSIQVTDNTIILENTYYITHYTSQQIEPGITLYTLFWDLDRFIEETSIRPVGPQPFMYYFNADTQTLSTTQNGEFPLTK